ncbi:MAG: tyrosine-type recombinase/integrase [Ruminiclostridium sp.]|nr:tyrosine-type recombinase/integrase [Ruminiclostridium sp.]
MLTKCPECKLQVSDLAVSCPHCGYPLKRYSGKKSAPRKKRMRLPNGFGQISEIRGRNLRNPFRVMITVGKDENGRPVCKPLKPRAYFPTYNEAYAALVEYNRTPYDIEADITVKQLYEIWFAEYEKSISSVTSIRQTKAAWEYCSEIYDMRVKALRPRHIKKCMEEGTAMFRGKTRHAPPMLQSRIKTLFNLMLDYAVEYEITDINHARSFKLSDDVLKEITTVKRSHIIYTDDEMRVLWEYTHNIFVCMVLVQCYSGWRPQELLTLKVEDVDIENLTFRGGLKTESGRNRVVPIHSRISGIVRRTYEESSARGCVYLFARANSEALPITYMQFFRAFSAIIDNIGISSDHRLHDGRTHFVTAAKKYGVDEYAIKYIVGHKISDITESVYTKRGPEWLREQIEKIV